MVNMDWGSLANAMNGAINGTIDLGMDIYSIFGNERANSQQQAQQGFANDFAQQQFQYQKDWNEKTFEYQKMLNQLQMEREDTAVQRKMKDLEAAGLHRSLAAGGAGAMSQPLSTSHGNASGGSVSNVPPAQRHQLQKMGQVVDLQDMAIKEQTLKDMRLGNERTAAEIARINAETGKIKQDTMYDPMYYQLERDKVRQALAESASKVALNEYDLRVRGPKEVANLIAEEALTRGRIKETQAHEMLMRAQKVTEAVRHEGELLRNAATRLGITEQEMTNLVLAHDMEIFLESGFASTDPGYMVENERLIESFDIDPQSKGGKALRALLMVVDKVGNIVGGVNRGPTRPETSRQGKGVKK